MVVKMLLDGELVSLMSADVMDIDEVAFSPRHSARQTIW